jgi:protease II
MVLLQDVQREKAPVAPKMKNILSIHNHQIIDNYKWMQDKANPKVNLPIHITI